MTTRAKLVRLARPAARVATVLGVLGALAVAAYSWTHAPDATLEPALLALIPWIVARYVVSPLRWHTLSRSGRGRWWHVRVYAEGEFLGILSPARSGTDLWRIHMLHRAGMTRTAALADVALDRMVGGAGLIVFVLLTGTAVPPAMLVFALGIAVAAMLAAAVVARMRPHLLRQRPLPTPGELARALPLAVVYQALSAVLLIGATIAIGHPVNAFELLAVFGASQIAGMLPGMHGAGPREGALVYGLVQLGVPLNAALGAISLTSLLTWLPPLALGGAALLVRQRRARRDRTAGLPALAA